MIDDKQYSSLNRLEKESFTDDTITKNNKMIASGLYLAHFPPMGLWQGTSII